MSNLLATITLAVRCRTRALGMRSAATLGTPIGLAASAGLPRSLGGAVLGLRRLLLFLVGGLHHSIDAQAIGG